MIRSSFNKHLLINNDISYVILKLTDKLHFIQLLELKLNNSLAYSINLWSALLKSNILCFLSPKIHIFVFVFLLSLYILQISS